MTTPFIFPFCSGQVSSEKKPIKYYIHFTVIVHVGVQNNIYGKLGLGNRKEVENQTRKLSSDPRLVKIIDADEKGDKQKQEAKD